MPLPPQPIQPVQLTAGDLVLRRWREDDVDAYWAALESPGGRLWHGSTTASKDDVATLLAQRRDWTPGDRAPWCVTGPAGELLGSLALHHIDLDQRDAELGYWTVPSARGRGIAVRAVEAAVRWGFTVLGLQRVQLFHAVENTASARVAEKAGFTLEGRLRRSHRFDDGRWHDELLWARLDDDPAPEG
jgi:RimJ/RimL family protein N-acetyltransferase